jgi:hypothetical protein
MSSSENRIVDIAVLAEDVKSSPVEFDGHIVDLDAIDMSENVFRDLFYASNNNELFLLNCANENSKTNITFNDQKMSDSSFNLLDQVLTSYSTDLGVMRECFEPCSLIEIQKQITGIKSLCDICEVKCSLKWSEVESSLVSLGGDISKGKKHRLRVNALFTNANPQVQSIMVRFNYNVTWE